MNGKRGDSAGSIDALEVMSGKAHQSVVCADPECSVAILKERANEVVAKSVGSAEGAETASLIAKQAAAFGANPEGAVAGDQQREDAIFLDGRCVLIIEKCEVRAVGAQQASGGADPEIVIRSLRE